jgi:hypothetical protein
MADLIVLLNRSIMVIITNNFNCLPLDGLSGLVHDKSRGETGMDFTDHFRQRMRQRGISSDMVDLVLQAGRIDQDRFVLDRRGALRLLEQHERQGRLIKKMLDKGGVTIVAEDGNLITTYNCTGRRRKR